jgi:segregation and condensation protein A
MIIKLEKFEGPLALLLKMIEKEEMQITDISLAKIADQYVRYIQSGKIDPEHVADFLVVAAKLLLIKSRALLPYLSVAEDVDIEEFEQQLRMYQEFVIASQAVDQLAKQKNCMYAREFNRRSIIAEQEFCPPKKLSAQDLANVFRELLSQIKPPLNLEKGELQAEINIEDKINAIKNLLSQKLHLVFSQVMASAKDRTEMIVSFLALLELTKQRDITIDQSELFGEIEINKIN